MNDKLHDRGLAFDLTTLRDRRNVLKLLGGVGLVALVGCGKSNNAAPTTTALAESGVVRSDIRSSFGTSATVAKGIPLTIKLRVLDQAKTCAPMAGAAVYVWHCDMDGNYSLYSRGVTNENY